MRYESEVLYDLMKRDGLLNPSQSNLPYESELKEKYVDEVKGAYPKAIDYCAEWLNYAYKNPNGEFPYETLTNVTEATINNVVPYAYKSAILTGSTKYRDIDTGEFLETFEEGRNLELVSVQMPVLTTTGKNLFDMNHVSYIPGLIHVSNQTINQTSNTKAYYIPCEPNTSYTISKMMTKYFRICETSVVPTYGCSISNIINNPSKASLTITTSESAKYLCFNVHNVKDDTVDESEVLATLQIEKGSTATTYEPYNSNILTVNEDVTLRSNGNIYDELNLLTGQLTQRINEDGEVLSQEVIKTVKLTIVNQDGDTSSKLTPIEGTMNLRTDGTPIKPTFSGEIPVEAITQNLASFVELEGVEQNE